MADVPLGRSDGLLRLLGLNRNNGRNHGGSDGCYGLILLGGSDGCYGLVLLGGSDGCYGLVLLLGDAGLIRLLPFGGSRGLVNSVEQEQVRRIYPRIDTLNQYTIGETLTTVLLNDMANVIHPGGGGLAGQILLGVFGDEDGITLLELIVGHLNTLFLNVGILTGFVARFHIVCHAISGHEQCGEYK